MKKVLFSMLALAIISIAFVSCKDDEEGKHGQPAAGTILGTYVGKWVKTAEDGTVTEYTAASSVVVEAGPNAYAVKLTTKCQGETGAEGDAVVNVSWSGDNVLFANTSTGSGTLGVEISGTKDANGNLTVKFMKSIRSGRTTKLFDFVFVGTKQ